jgi:uncharacterized protein (TIGR03067 family)
MKKLFACIVCFSLSALIAAAGNTKGAPKLDGSWAGIAAIVDGKKLPDDEVAKAMLVVTIKDGKYAVSVMGKQLEAGTYKTDAEQKPAFIDLTITEGKDKGKTQLGIFKVDGTQLTIAIAAAGAKDRPKTFEGVKDVEITTLKRNK